MTLNIFEVTNVAKLIYSIFVFCLQFFLIFMFIYLFLELFLDKPAMVLR